MLDSEEHGVLLSSLLDSGADPGFFLVGGALVSCSTSTLINHIVFFFAEYQLYQKTAGHIMGGGGAHPLPPPLDPPLGFTIASQTFITKLGPNRTTAIVTHSHPFGQRRRPSAGLIFETGWPGLQPDDPLQWRHVN